MLRTMQRGALALALSLTAAGCVADTPTIPARDPGARAPSSALLPILARCEPLPYASDVETIGRAGGQLQVGPHRLTIPAGALDAPTVITAEAPTGNEVVVRFSPDGLRFSVPATLTLSHRHCPSVLGLTERIVQVDDLLGILDVLPSANLPDGEVSAPLRHFSGYAVAW